MENHKFEPVHYGGYPPGDLLILLDGRMFPFCKLNKNYNLCEISILSDDLKELNIEDISKRIMLLQIDNKKNSFSYNVDYDRYAVKARSLFVPTDNDIYITLDIIAEYSDYRLTEEEMSYIKDLNKEK